MLIFIGEILLNQNETNQNKIKLIKKKPQTQINILIINEEITSFLSTIYISNINNTMHENYMHATIECK